MTSLTNVLTRIGSKRGVISSNEVGATIKTNDAGDYWGHFRRVMLELINLLAYPLAFLVGQLNRRFGFLETVFLAYPASEDYGRWYAYAPRLKRNTWRPFFAGIFRQNGRWGVMFTVSSHNGSFEREENRVKLQTLIADMEAWRLLLGAKQKTFAGILPGVFFFRRLVKQAPEADLTAEVVCQAIDQVKWQEGLSSVTPVIILGGRGFIGRRVVRKLKVQGGHVETIDLDKNLPVWPERALVVNITRNNALEQYLPHLHQGMVVLNEVYPEPTTSVLSILRGKGVPCYHVAGVVATAWPAFPSAYHGAIPCCAAWPAKEIEVSLKKL